MDPTNPRWETRESRRQRGATIWKVIVAAAGASALTAVIVASCLDRDEARRDAEEPAVVETTAGAPAATATATVAPTATVAATATAAEQQPATTETTGATIVSPRSTTIIENMTIVAPSDTSSAPQPPPELQSTQPPSTQLYPPTGETPAAAVPLTDADASLPWGATVLDIPTW